MVQSNWALNRDINPLLLSAVPATYFWLTVVSWFDPPSRHKFSNRWNENRRASGILMKNIRNPSLSNTSLNWIATHTYYIKLKILYNGHSNHKEMLLPGAEVGCTYCRRGWLDLCRLCCHPVYGWVWLKYLQDRERKRTNCTNLADFMDYGGGMNIVWYVVAIVHIAHIVCIILVLVSLCVVSSHCC